MKALLANINLLVPVDRFEEGYNEDVISAILTENLESSGIILDWQYVNKRKPVTLDVAEDYKEGDAFVELEGLVWFRKVSILGKGVNPYLFEIDIYVDHEGYFHAVFTEKAVEVFKQKGFELINFKRDLGRGMFCSETFRGLIELTTLYINKYTV